MLVLKIFHAFNFVGQGYPPKLFNLEHFLIYGIVYECTSPMYVCILCYNYALSIWIIWIYHMEYIFLYINVHSYMNKTVKLHKREWTDLTNSPSLLVIIIIGILLLPALLLAVTLTVY